LKIDLLDITYAYQPNHPVFEQLTLHFPVDRWIGLVGECGTGKSTLARLIAGLLQPQGGRIRYPWPIESLPFGFLFQNPEDQLVQLNLERELAFGLENRAVPRAEIAARVASALRAIGLWERRFDSPQMLSGGEKQRLALAGMLITEPRMLILDEPTAYLDLPSQKWLLQEVRRLHRNGTGILWITQDWQELDFCDWVIRLEPTGLGFCGPRSEDG